MINRVRDDKVFFISKQIKFLLKNKIYIFSLLLTSVLTFGFLLTHETYGMDDTAVSLYYEVGLAPYMGRWFIFLMNFITFHSITTMPMWASDLLGIIFLIIASITWCALWRYLLADEKENVFVYIIFSGLFLSNPILSELTVFSIATLIIGLGYWFVSLSLFFFLKSMMRIRRKKKLIFFVAAIFFELLAIACIESMAIMFVIASVCAYALLIYSKNQDINSNCGLWILKGLVLLILVLIGRTFVTKILFVIFNLKTLDCYNMGYYKLFGNLLNDVEELKMIIKRFYMKYYVSAILYVPITMLLLSYIVLFCIFVKTALKEKKVVVFLCCLSLPILPLLMSIVEGLTTRYRSAQYIPFISAFSIMLLYYECKDIIKKNRFVNVISIVTVMMLIMYQAKYSTKMYEIDYEKYEDVCSLLENVAVDLEEMEVDCSKPIIFLGAHKVPYDIISDGYVSYSSKKFNYISRLTDFIDPYLKEKYYDGEHGLCYYETPHISTLQWGITAFDGTCNQLITLWKLLGTDEYSCETNLNVIENADHYIRDNNIPSYPNYGYIVENDQNIIINIVD